MRWEMGGWGSGGGERVYDICGGGEGDRAATAGTTQTYMPRTHTHAACLFSIDSLFTIAVGRDVFFPRARHVADRPHNPQQPRRSGQHQVMQISRSAPPPLPCTRSHSIEPNQEKGFFLLFQRRPQVDMGSLGPGCHRI